MRSFPFVPFAGLLSLLCLTLTHSSVALGQVSVISSREIQRPPDPGCGASGTCDLKAARFVEMKKRVDFPNEPRKYASYLTDTRFAFTVSSPDQIENYAVVQYLRGCIFESRLVNGNVVKDLSVTRQHFGKSIPFQHKDWEIDSDTTDPIYSSYEGYGRFALLRWNRDPQSLDPDTATYYAEAKPPHGTVFLTDLPGTAHLNPGDTSARNVSLEFRTCLFKTSDLPLQTTPRGAGIDPSRALWCVSWDHKFVWDFKTNQMRRPAAIDPVCEVRAP